jgi:multidrug transporter EmrE-like cation transporter
LATSSIASPPPAAASHQPVLLVFCCTIIGAAAQMLIKFSAVPAKYPTLQAAIAAKLTNPSLMLGYSLYGINTALLVLALRKGQLSLLYPVIALTYVWVTMLSFFVFHEQLNIFKMVGLALIMLGVSVIGKK